jgi:GntR family transcriptional regulator
MKLDTSSPIPLHAQLKERLKSEINKGEYLDKIPSERDLMDAFAVSRTTVREAVSALVQDGLLQKIHGKGTFISSCKVKEWLGTIKSFTETVENMGLRPGIRLLRHGKGREPEIASVLEVDEYYTVERLRFADDEPVALERTHYPVEIGLMIAHHDLNMVTIYNVLETNGIILHTADQKITAVMPTREDAKLLRISSKTAILSAERVTCDPAGKVIEYYSSIFRPDKYAFYVKMYRSPGESLPSA